MALATRWPWLSAIALAFLLVSLARPQLLAPLNRAWTQLAMLLYYVTNPIILGLIFFLIVTPLGLLMRWAGQDNLHPRPDRTAKSYWIRRDPPGPPPETMKNQF